jgi:uncharacterized protein (TIGR03083 family)
MAGPETLRRLHDEEDAELGAYLRSLPAADWDRPSLCDGWRVRDVVGHILDGNELRLSTLPLRLARHGFSSDRSGRAHAVARAEGRTPDELVDAFEARDPWAGTCRVFPPRYVLLDRLVHHQDIRRALGHPRVIPDERLRPCVEMAPRLGSVFGAKARVRGLRLEASDLGWTWGSGPLVRGPAEALLVAMLGRGQAIGDLDGDGLGTFAGRMRPPVSA